MREAWGGRTLDVILRLWWGRLPAAVYRVSPQTGLCLADGIHIVAWRWVGAVAPPAAFLAGLLLGWRHPGFQFVWAESIPFLVLVVVAGTVSGSLGALLVLGYAVGDFALGNQHWPVPVPSAAPGVLGGTLPEPVRLRLPLVIGYLLLLVPAARIPLFVKTLLADAARGRAGTDPGLGTKVFAMAAHATVTGALVWAWVNALPVLIRPRFTWIGALAPPSTVYGPLQTQGGVLVAAAVAASLARMLHQFPLALDGDVQARFDTAQRAVIDTAKRSMPPGPVRLWLRAASAGLIAAGLACGILANWLEVVIILTGTVALYAARAGLLPVPLGAWPSLVERVPLVLRLAAAWLAIQWLASQLIVNPLVTGGKEDLFRPFVVTTVLGLIVLYVLAPHAGRARGQDDARGGSDRAEERSSA